MSWCQVHHWSQITYLLFILLSCTNLQLLQSTTSALFTYWKFLLFFSLTQWLSCTHLYLLQSTTSLLFQYWHSKVKLLFHLPPVSFIIHIFCLSNDFHSFSHHDHSFTPQLWVVYLRPIQIAHRTVCVHNAYVHMIPYIHIYALHGDCAEPYGCVWTTADSCGKSMQLSMLSKVEESYGAMHIMNMAILSHVFNYSGVWIHVELSVPHTVWTGINSHTLSNEKSHSWPLCSMALLQTNLAWLHFLISTDRGRGLIPYREGWTIPNFWKSSAHSEFVLDVRYVVYPRKILWWDGQNVWLRIGKSLALPVYFVRFLIRCSVSN